jgi:tRNA 2-thiouridine synthesizing protein A
MHRVDVTGEVCPRPALIVRRELSDLPPGGELLVVGDYPPAEENLRRTCGKHGYDVSDAPEEATDDTFALRIGATEDTSLQEA